MFTVYIAIAVLAVGIAAFLSLRALRPGALRRGRGSALPPAEALLLEEAVVTEPIAPGLEGKAELRKPGAKPLPLRVKAGDPSQVFARGSMVRVIDLREGCCIIESADEVHLVR
jgi:hypothetical protein